MNVVETKKTQIESEVKVAEASHKNEAKLPDNIYLRTKPRDHIHTGEVIVMEAISPTVYIKSYFSGTAFNTGEPLVNPRRTKTVTLPVSVNGKSFKNTMSLFIELVNSNGYRRL